MTVEYIGCIIKTSVTQRLRRRHSSAVLLIGIQMRSAVPTTDNYIRRYDGEDIMKYNKRVILKNGIECTVENGTESDGESLRRVFNQTHAETDYLLSYPDENSFTVEAEQNFLKEKTESEREIEIVAKIDGVVVGSAGVEQVGEKYKLRHRAEFGISILKDYWGLGIGRILTEACIECARKAGYTQLELDVVADNERAIGMYKSVGFAEFGRNPRGFNSRESGYQELVYMRLEL